MTSQFTSLPVWEETVTGYICSQNTDRQKAQTTSELEKAQIREYLGTRLHQSGRRKLKEAKEEYRPSMKKPGSKETWPRALAEDWDTNQNGAAMPGP